MSQPAFKADYIAAQVPWMVRAHREVLRRLAALCRRAARCATSTPTSWTYRRRSRAITSWARASSPSPTGSAARRSPSRTRGPCRRAACASCCAAAATAGRTSLARAVRDIDVCVYEYLTAERRRDFAGAGLVKMLVDGSRAQGDEFDDRSLRDQILTVFFAGPRDDGDVAVVDPLLARQESGRAPQAARRGRRTCSAAARRRTTTSIASSTRSRSSTRRCDSIRRFTRCRASRSRTTRSAATTSRPAPRSTSRCMRRIGCPSLWPDPDRFDPERFTKDLVERRPRFAFIPFAAGHRNCVGASTAIVELKLAVAMIAQRYELTVAPGHRVEGAAGTTMHPRYGMNMLHPGNLSLMSEPKPTGGTRHTRLLRSCRRHRSAVHGAQLRIQQRPREQRHRG